MADNAHLATDKKLEDGKVAVCNLLKRKEV